MVKWCGNCQKNIPDPGTSEISKYAKFWRDNRCYHCDAILVATSKENLGTSQPQVSRTGPQFKIHEVVHVGLDIRGQGELDSLLSEGWQIWDLDDSETWHNGEAWCRVYKYKLRKD